MRHSTSRPVSRSLVVLVLALVVAGLLGAAAAAAETQEPAAGPDATAASPSAEPTVATGESPSPAPTTITCGLSRAAVVFGDSVTARGMVTPAAAGVEVAVVLGGVRVATALTDDSGAYSAAFTPRRGGSVVARVVADGTAAEPLALAVKPRVTVTRGAAVPFLKTRFIVKVAPLTYDGVVTARVSHRGVAAGTYRVRVRDGRAVFGIPLRGIDWFTVTFALPPDGGLAARSAQKKVDVDWRRLSVGSSGAHLKGMLTGLVRLKIRVPGMGTRFGSSTRDAVVAFQKAYRLPRTYSFAYADWRKLDGAVPVKPRYASPAVHIEVDKTRQILMIVRTGKVSALIAVSTGATGNTPEGAFRIQQKHPSTSTFTGDGVLFRTMGFLGNFAIHGWVSVPPYPASHGCVREPMWVAPWVYDQSWVGERVYIYR